MNFAQFLFHKERLFFIEQRHFSFMSARQFRFHFYESSLKNIYQVDALLWHARLPRTDALSFTCKRSTTGVYNSYCFLQVYWFKIAVIYAFDAMSLVKLKIKFIILVIVVKVFYRYTDQNKCFYELSYERTLT